MVLRIPHQLVIHLLWFSVVAGGFAAVARQNVKPGAVGVPADHTPNGATIFLDGTRPTLIMFAHPKCPCTRASMEEFNRLLARCHGAVAPRVVFFVPDEASRDWTHTDLWQSASQIPGVMAVADPGGREASRFGAETSGHVLLYDPRGHLLFSGGITKVRGHAGDNAGAEAIVAILSSRDHSSQTTPVFGCSLRHPPTSAASNRAL